MAGINFNDLPKNLQAKLNEFRFVAKSVDDAIEMAKAKGTWTEADTKAMSALNGNKAFGVFDGFEKSKTQKGLEELAAEVKKDPANAVGNLAKKHLAEDVKKHPEKYEPKTMYMPSGRYVVYKKDKNTGKESYTYFDANGKTMTAKDFQRAEDLKQPLSFGRDKNGKLVAKAVGFGGEKVSNWMALNPLAWLTSCSNEDDVKEYNFVNENKNTINLTIINENSSIAELVAALNECIQGLRDDLNDIKDLIVTIITNQEKNAASFEAYAKMILDAVGDNSALIKILIDQMTENNDTLKGLKELITKNHEEDVQYQKKVLELLAGIKFSVDKLSADLGDYYNNIIATMVKNNVSLEKIENMIKALNKSVDNLNALITKYATEGEKLGKAILEAINKLNLNTVNSLAGIEAMLKQIIENQKISQGQIKNLTELFTKYSADTIARLNTIIDKMGTNSTKLDAIIELLAKMDANNEQRTKQIIAAIEKLGDDIVVNLNTIIAKLDKSSPDYSEQLAKIIELIETLDKNNEARNQKVLEAIEKLGTDVATSLTAILQAIKDLPINEQKDYTEILNAILDKIKEGNAQNDANFKAVLAKIDELGISVSFGMNAILEAIQNMPDYTEKLNSIIEKLDALGSTAKEILQAIKDHDVKITVDVTGKVKCECNCNCGGPHEGIIGDLNDLLG